MTNYQKKNLFFGAVLIILLAWYLILRVQIFNFGQKADALEEKLSELRPTLTAIVSYDQLQKTRKSYTNLWTQIRKMDLKADILLTVLSHKLPPSVQLSRIEAFSSEMLRIEGFMTPGARDPEAVLIPWVKVFVLPDQDVSVMDLFPSSEMPGKWHFLLQVEKKDA